MDDERPQVNRHKRLTIIGCVFLIMPGAIDWSWGCVSVYASSFVASLQGTSGLGVPWISSLYLLFYAGGIAISGLACGHLAEKWIMLIGSLLLNCSLLWSYFAIQSSLDMLNVSCGVLMACGQGLLYGNAVQIVIPCAEKNTAFLLSLLPSSFSLGALINSQIITAYVNPTKELPNVDIGSNGYFTQKEIVDRIPCMFLILLSLTIIMHVIGYSLLQFNPDMRFIDFKSTNVKPEKIYLKFKDILKTSLGGKPVHYTSTSQFPIVYNYSYPEVVKHDPNDYRPTDIVKTGRFFSLFASVFSSSYSIVIIVNIYKVFGRLWFGDDDPFLSQVESVFILSNALSRIALGLALDRYGIRHCVMTVLCVITLTLAWYYFMAVSNVWLYLLATLIIGSCAGSISSSHLAATAMLFGKSHVTANYGTLVFMSATFDMSVPTLLDIILDTWGWFTVFAGAAALNIVSLALCLHYLPHPSKQNKNR